MLGDQGGSDVGIDMLINPIIIMWIRILIFYGTLCSSSEVMYVIYVATLSTTGINHTQSISLGCQSSF